MLSGRSLWSTTAKQLRGFFDFDQIACFSLGGVREQGFSKNAETNVIYIFKNITLLCARAFEYEVFLVTLTSFSLIELEGFCSCTVTSGPSCFQPPVCSWRVNTAMTRVSINTYIRVCFSVTACRCVTRLEATFLGVVPDSRVSMQLHVFLFVFTLYREEKQTQTNPPTPPDTRHVYK